MPNYSPLQEKLNANSSLSFEYEKFSEVIEKSSNWHPFLINKSLTEYKNDMFYIVSGTQNTVGEQIDYANPDNLNRTIGIDNFRIDPKDSTLYDVDHYDGVNHNG